MTDREEAHREYLADLQKLSLEQMAVLTDQYAVRGNSELLNASLAAINLARTLEAEGKDGANVFKLTWKGNIPFRAFVAEEHGGDGDIVTLRIQPDGYVNYFSSGQANCGGQVVATYRDVKVAEGPDGDNERIITLVPPRTGLICNDARYTLERVVKEQQVPSAEAVRPDEPGQGRAVY